MSPRLQFTEEQIAAAQLRIVVDQKLGRPTPEIVRQIANHRPAEGIEPSATPRSTSGDPSAPADDPLPGRPEGGTASQWVGEAHPLGHLHLAYPDPDDAGEGDEFDSTGLGREGIVVVTGSHDEFQGISSFIHTPHTPIISDIVRGVGGSDFPPQIKVASLASFLRAQQEVEHAQHDAERAADPADAADRLTSLGRALQDVGRTAEAAHTFEQALEIYRQMRHQEQE